jgi:uncharacterized damage-inducible protein DinB
MAISPLELAIVEEAKLRIEEESLARIIQCIESLTLDQLWSVPHPVLNSVGNLVLHLSGNLRQYLCHGIGEEEDSRERDSEFVPGQKISKEELQRLITSAVRDGLASIEKTTDWTTERDIQCFTMTKYRALIHAIEHLSYHVGQITLLTKWHTGKETHYYGDLDLT